MQLCSRSALVDSMMETLSAIADAVMKAVDAIPSGVDIGEELCIGADGTPTSQIDKIAENTVLMYIESNKVPLNVLSEEIGFVDNGAKDTLILDPIDGTRNAVLGIPYYTVSLAVTDSDLNGVHTALLRNLVTGDEYRAEKGKGATYNGRRLNVKRSYDPRDITLNIYLGKSSDPHAYEVAKRVKASRSMGCASLDMAMIALGRADGFLMQSENYTHSIRIVDIAASVLILREAGGEVYNLDGSVFNMPLDLDYRANFLAVSQREVFDLVMNGESSRDKKSSVRFGIYANMNIADVTDIARQVIAELGDSEYFVDSALASALGTEGMPLRDMDVDIVIVLGGDGTLLRATHNTDAKIVGVNAGSVGFLTAIERDQIKEGIARLKSGDYTVERRSKIRVTCDGEVLGDAINEALVHTDSVAKIRQFRVYVDDSLLTEVKADGFMLSTVTGSTSYAMSLGAPIMDPRVGNAWELVPVAAFKYTSRPIIVPTTARITIETVYTNKDCLLVIDGQSEIPLAGGKSVVMTLSPKYGRIISMGADFYKRVSQKLVNSL